jgi:uncharacterized protein YecT (DUF1311 family)
MGGPGCTAVAQKRYKEDNVSNTNCCASRKLIRKGLNMKKILATLLLGASSAAMANSACDVPKNDFDGLYCLNKVYQEADKELNENYKNLSGKLDADGKKALKTGQLAWIETRNNSCSKREANGFYVNLDCATSRTIKRAQFLQDRVRECASAGCQNSKLKD